MDKTKKDKEQDYICPLCGTRFVGNEAAKCAECSKLSRCNMVMCPNCGYELPKASGR